MCQFSSAGVSLREHCVPGSIEAPHLPRVCLKLRVFLENVLSVLPWHLSTFLHSCWLFGHVSQRRLKTRREPLLRVMHPVIKYELCVFNDGMQPCKHVVFCLWRTDSARETDYEIFRVATVSWFLSRSFCNSHVTCDFLSSL